MEEVGENIAVHSQTYGFVAAQLFPSRAVIRFAVADAGVSLLNTLRGSGATSDKHALSLALAGKSRLGGTHGMALSETWADIAHLGGSLVLASGGSGIHRAVTDKVCDAKPDRKDRTSELLTSLAEPVRGREGIQLRARTQTAAQNLQRSGEPAEHASAFAESEALPGWLNYTQGQLRHPAEDALGGGQPYRAPVENYLLLRRRFAELGAWVTFRGSLSCPAPNRRSHRSTSCATCVGWT